MATTRRRFTAQFKAKVAMEALRGDPHDPGDRSQARGSSESGERLEAAGAGRSAGILFAGASNRRQKDHDATIHDLHGKIGELTVERDFLSRGLGR